ncbi:MAG: GIY-YIG nuclease family protein [Spirochaetes bacterium]|nr:GIY-YIG nuclease family protein [Spirochaetota bacterium]
MPFVYILECSDGTYYTGSAKDIDNRFQAHQSGKGAKYTRGRLPVKLVYFEKFESMNDAYKREKEIQKLTKSQKKNLFGIL